MSMLPHLTIGFDVPPPHRSRNGLAFCSYALGLTLTLVACGDTKGNQSSGSASGATDAASDSGGSSASGDPSSSASTSSGAGTSGGGDASTGSGGELNQTSGGAAGSGGAATTSAGGGEGGEGATTNGSDCTNPDPIPEAMLPEVLARSECRVALDCECSVAQSYSSQSECETARRQYYEGWQAVIQNQGYSYDAECAAKFVGYFERRGCYSYQIDWCPSVGCNVYSGSSTTSCASPAAIPYSLLHFVDDCSPPQYCDEDPVAGTRTCSELALAEGETGCASGATCGPGLLCLDDECVPQPQPGDACFVSDISDGYCGVPYNCVDGICQDTPGEGEPCAPAGGLRCNSYSLYCASDETCRLPSLVGEPCGDGQECVAGAVCEGDVCTPFSGIDSRPLYCQLWQANINFYSP